MITAGAGMGVDAGLPDFRGPEGFWRAYPAYRKLGRRFEEMANPQHFAEDPAVGWGFYGHRQALYRTTEPHWGYHRLRAWSKTLPGGAFVFTSNVDHHFVRAGFPPERIEECHGNIFYRQCAANCSGEIWEGFEDEVLVNGETMRAEEPLPRCPGCGGLARPNILMFGDWGWSPERTAAQEERRRAWMGERQGQRVAILEFGAGTGVPTVRWFSEQAARALGSHARLIRVNPREPEVPPGEVGLAMGGLVAIEKLLSGEEA